MNTPDTHLLFSASQYKLIVFPSQLGIDPHIHSPSMQTSPARAHPLDENPIEIRIHFGLDSIMDIGSESIFN